MKAIRTLLTAAAIIMLTVHQAWAVDTTRAGQGGIIVLLFLGICALIVVAQMVPALILLLGMISGLVKAVGAKRQVAVAGGNQEKSE